MQMRGCTISNLQDYLALQDFGEIEHFFLFKLILKSLVRKVCRLDQVSSRLYKACDAWEVCSISDVHFASFYTTNRPSLQKTPFNFSEDPALSRGY